MTNYNDGKWHGWDGGDCPVHPESVIEAVYILHQSGSDTMLFNNAAREKHWASPCLFRVIAENREPRTVTLYEDDAGNFGMGPCFGFFKARKFLEVLE